MLNLLGELAEKSQRKKTTKKVAKAIGADALLIFIKDAELDILLPAVGFPQTLKDASKWQIFIKRCIKQKICEDTLLFSKKVIGIAYKDECVFVFIGEKTDKHKIEFLYPALPMLTKIFKYEQFEIQTKAQLRLTDKTVIEMQRIEKKLNITRHELQNALAKTEKEIIERKKSEKQKDDFMAIASHELKTPVTSIKMHTQILEHKFKKSGDIKSAEAVAKVDVQINKLINLINDLLDVAKMEEGKIMFNFGECDLNKLSKEIIEDVQLSAKHKIDFFPGDIASVVADHERIGQVITNFLSNAIKYSPGADRIIVKTLQKGKYVTASVQDFGMGLTEKEQEKVFERFNRGGQEGPGGLPGLGLGLYISKEIIKRHKGKIWVKSVKGKGSTFSFTIPINKM